MTALCAVSMSDGTERGHDVLASAGPASDSTGKIVLWNPADGARIVRAQPRGRHHRAHSMAGHSLAVGTDEGVAILRIGHPAGRHRYRS